MLWVIPIASLADCKTNISSKGFKVSSPKVLDSELELAFFPEGGELISGFVNRIGVTVNNPQEKPLRAKLMDDSGQELLEFSISTLGLGEFKFIPDFRKNYYVLIQLYHGTQRFELPKISKEGLFLKVVPFQDHFRVGIRSKEVSSLKGYAYTISQNDGLVLTGEIVKRTSDVLIKIPKELLTPGIFEFKLFDRSGSILVKRRAFNKTVNDIVQMNVSFDQTHEVDNDSITVDVSVSNILNQPLTTCLSIQRLNELNPFLVLTANNQTLADLKMVDTQTEDQLDILMLSRNNDFKSFEGTCGALLEEEGVTVEGLVKNIFNDEPLKYAKVGLYFKNNDEIGIDETTTDSNGRFTFSELDFYDRTSVLVQLKDSGKKSGFKVSDYGIELDSAKTFYGSPNNTLNQISVKEFDNLRKERNRLDSTYFNVADLVKLENIEIKGAKKRAREEMRKKRRILYKKPSQTIDFEELPNIPFANPLDALAGRVPGLSFVDNRPILRGSNSFNLNDSRPLILVDGTPIDNIDGLNQSFYDVEFIDVIKGPRAAIYGSRAAGGIIAIYTKDGRKTKTVTATGVQLAFVHPGKPKEKIRKASKAKVVFQNPSLQLESGTSELSFRIPEKPGQYMVTLKGIGLDGEPYDTKTLFTIKP